MSYELVVSPRARAQIRAAAGWWLENRPKAPSAFSEEIDRAFNLITALPAIGEPVQHSRLSGLRRILIGRVRYHLYYLAPEDTDTVEILALWHTSRGSGPKL